MMVTPGQLTARAEFYYQLSQLTTAGIGVVPALQRLQKNPPAQTYRERIGRALRRIETGCTLAEGLAQSGPWLPDFDVTLIDAGEKSGRLVQSFQSLAQYYNSRASMMKRVIADLAYPAFLFHFAVFILPFPNLFLTGDWILYLRQTLTILLPIYLVVGLGVYLLQSGHGESWRACVESLLHPVPILGRARRYLALARLSAALEALVSAGVNIVEAWSLAAAASGSPALRRTVLSWKKSLAAGQTPAEVMAASAAFPSMFSDQYATGEVSGTLDETLRRLHQYYQEEGGRKLHAVARWVPIFLYLGVMGYITYQIITFYLGRFEQLRDVMTI